MNKVALIQTRHNSLSLIDSSQVWKLWRFWAINKDYSIKTQCCSNLCFRFYSSGSDIYLAFKSNHTSFKSFVVVVVVYATLSKPFKIETKNFHEEMKKAIVIARMLCLRSSSTTLFRSQLNALPTYAIKFISSHALEISSIQRFFLFIPLQCCILIKNKPARSWRCIVNVICYVQLWSHIVSM